MALQTLYSVLIWYTKGVDLMTNEDKILEVITGIQKNLADIKQGQTEMRGDISNLKEGQQRVEDSLQRLETKVDKLATDQVQDIYTVLQMTYDKIERLDSKFNVLNSRMYEQEATADTLLKRIK